MDALYDNYYSKYDTLSTFLYACFYYLKRNKKAENEASKSSRGAVSPNLKEHNQKNCDIPYGHKLYRFYMLWGASFGNAPDQ